MFSHTVDVVGDSRNAPAGRSNPYCLFRDIHYVFLIFELSQFFLSFHAFFVSDIVASYICQLLVIFKIAVNNHLSFIDADFRFTILLPAALAQFHIYW